MNWDAIGAIAETLGAVGVIASLVYLATQMSRNTQAMRAETSQLFYRGFSEDMWKAWTIPGFQPTINQGIEDFHQLDDEGALRFTWWATAQAQDLDNAYCQYRSGTR